MGRGAQSAEGTGAAGGSGDGLRSAARLEALRQMQLSASADPGMERFARLVAETLGVPVALVSLAEAGRQVFPGQVGLAESRASSGQTALVHSLCQRVAATGRPLVLADACQDEQARDSGASEPGMIAYAGLPLTDSDGHVLGALCAVDTRPRAWSPRELARLADLAAACGAELRLRITSRYASHAVDAAERSQAATREYAAQARLALDRSELMLRAAEDLADTAGLADVRRRVRNLVTGNLKPSYVGLALLDGKQLRWLPDSDVINSANLGGQVFAPEYADPSARAARQGGMVIVTGRAAQRAGQEWQIGTGPGAAELETAVYVPLLGTTRMLGTLVLGWDTPHQVDVTEQAVLTAIAGYTARAIGRALYLDQRVTVAIQLQQAMLTDLPAVSGLELAAFYRPAADGELVGGDWYDAYPLAPAAREPQPPSGTGPESVLPLVLTIGDVTGHDMQAATIMGQIRSMLRQADFDHPDRGPAAAVTAVENACTALGLDATGTLVHAHLSPAGGGAWHLSWSNAGHPPPLLLARPGGRPERLAVHDPLLWPGLTGPRTSQQRLLPPGATLLLYTDGLVERRDSDIDDAIDRTAAILAAAPADRPLPALLEQLAAEIADPGAADDMVLLVARIPAGRA
jgi:serine phosphatase RsbU (regulator of sigma subunit)/transcriptional regulator with GAF, ATPase, and Fis domain